MIECEQLDSSTNFVNSIHSRFVCSCMGTSRCWIRISKVSKKLDLSELLMPSCTLLCTSVAWTLVTLVTHLRRCSVTLHQLSSSSRLNTDNSAICSHRLRCLEPKMHCAYAFTSQQSVSCCKVTRTSTAARSARRSRTAKQFARERYTVSYTQAMPHNHIASLCTSDLRHAGTGS